MCLDKNGYLRFHLISLVGVKVARSLSVQEVPGSKPPPVESAFIASTGFLEKDSLNDYTETFIKSKVKKTRLHIANVLKRRKVSKLNS